MESETQRRKRVVGRIKVGLVQDLAKDLIRLAKANWFPSIWMTARELNRILDTRGYWLNHPDPMAPFLGLQGCEQLVEDALLHLTLHDARTWWREGERFHAWACDWDQQARESADRLARESLPSERTALHGGPDQPSLIFATQSCESQSSVEESIQLLRKHLKEAGIPELAFAASDGGRTWVMLVWSKLAADLEQVLFAAWRAGVGSHHVQL